MSLKHAYTALAPLYDPLLARATWRLRSQSLQTLASLPAGDVLVNGIGTGLDLPHLPPQHRYVGLDLTRAMLKRARTRMPAADVALVQGDSLRLPFGDARFDHAVLHLILAVVPQPATCLAETLRVLKPGGCILLLDKFLRPGERAPLRRALNPLSRRIATRLDVVFEEVIATAPGLTVESDEPAWLSGWFRLIRLRKAA